MIKARTFDPDGHPVVFFGLSGENVTRLMAGEPILFNLAELDLPPMKVIIAYGRTEQAIKNDLEQHLRVMILDI